MTHSNPVTGDETGRKNRRKSDVIDAYDVCLNARVYHRFIHFISQQEKSLHERMKRFLDYYYFQKLYEHIFNLIHKKYAFKR